jgi:hypothetical protein
MSPLRGFCEASNVNRRQSRWMEFLSRFTYSLLYIPGDKIVIADALSRMLTAPCSPLLELPGDTWPHSANTHITSDHSILITETSTRVLHTDTHICAGPDLFHTHIGMVYGTHVAHPIGPRECAIRVPLQGRSNLDCGPNSSQLKVRLDDNIVVLIYPMNRRHVRCRTRQKAWLHTKGCSINYSLDCEMQL